MTPFLFSGRQGCGVTPGFALGTVRVPSPADGALLMGKVASKMWGLYPVIGLFRHDSQEREYYILLMSTGLTFGIISGRFGLSHGLLSQEEDSYIVAT